MFSGKGSFFDAIRRSIDPVEITHPVWDERILLNDIPADSWVSGYEVPAEAIVRKNVSQRTSYILIDWYDGFTEAKCTIYMAVNLCDVYMGKKSPEESTPNIRKLGSLAVGKMLFS